MSWLSDSGVLTKRDMLNVQSREAREPEFGTTGLDHVSFTGERTL